MNKKTTQTPSFSRYVGPRVQLYGDECFSNILNALFSLEVSSNIPSNTHQFFLRS